jgi:methylmalonyl-CoA/ethylmalonyl-CoA epimerase
VALVIDHLGIAVRSLDQAAPAWAAALGMGPAGREEVPGQGVRVAMFAVGGPKLELLEPMTPEGPVGKFLESRGEGIHHIAFRVDDVNAALARAKDAGARMIDETPRRGAGGALVGFVHPKSLNGVLVEFVQRP